MLSINGVKKVKAKLLEAFVEHNVHIRVLNIHTSETNVHVWVLKNSGYNLLHKNWTGLIF